MIALPAMAQDSFLADKHVTKSVNCTACHETQAPKQGAEVSSGKCVQCHGTLENLAAKQKTKNLILILITITWLIRIAKNAIEDMSKVKRLCQLPQLKVQGSLNYDKAFSCKMAKRV